MDIIKNAFVQVERENKSSCAPNEDSDTASLRIQALALVEIAKSLDRLVSALEAKSKPNTQTE